MHTLQDIALQISNDRLQEAKEALDSYIEVHSQCDEALFLRGKVYWRMGNRSAATCDYAAAAALNPGSPAVAALDFARDIEDFFNPDLFNP